MAARAQRRGWRIARLLFRGVRIFILLLILTVVIAVIWLNHVGVPDLLKQRIVVELRARGMDVQFRQMRLIWYRGLVAEDVQFGRTDQPIGPRVSAIQAELRFAMRSLLHRRLELKGIVLHGGRVVLPVWGATRELAVPREFVFESIGGELKFHPHDEWELANLQAQAFGVKLRMQGAITNASMIRNWKFWREPPSAKTPQAFWAELLADFEKTKFDPPSEILATITGDAVDLQTFRASVNIASPAIASPWGKGKQIAFSAQIAPDPGHLLFADVKLQANSASTRWGDAATLKLAAQIAPSLTQWTPTNAHIEMEVKGASTQWGSAAALKLKTDFRSNAGLPDSSRAEYEFRAQQIQSRWGRMARAQVDGIAVVSSSNLWPSTLTTRLNFSGGDLNWGRAASGLIESRVELPVLEALEFSNTNISWWTRADKIRTEIKATLTDVHSAKLDVPKLAVSGDWQFPLLNVREFHASVYDGEVHGAAQLDTASRQLSTSARTTFDPKRAEPLLSTNARRWLSYSSWGQPPELHAAVNAVLPPWTNQNRTWQQIDWRNEVMPTLKVEGGFDLSDLIYRQVSALSAQSDVTFSNFVWRLPNLKLARPEGDVLLGFISDDRTGDFQLTINSRIDPKAILPWLSTNESELIEKFQLTEPPHVRGEASGNWRDPLRTSFRADLRATNLSFRAQPVLACDTTITLTNRILTFEQPHVVRSEGSAAATEVRIDFAREKILINNATGSIDVAALTLAIGPEVASTMEPYHFLAPPQGRADGILDLKDNAATELHFSGIAAPFQWHAFRFQQITGSVHWLGNNLMFSNVQGSLLGGSIQGSAAFNLKGKDHGADFAFRTLFNGIDLQALTRDVGGKTNRVEGTLAGLLVITNANSESFETWDGYGSVTLQEGLLWEFPIFGVFSPVLNVMKPGAGNSRAKDATASFGITNSVIYSSDVQIHASGMRLLYSGTVDFDAKVKGRMEAELFRDTPAVGNVVSKVLWPVTKLFEYRIGGTLGKPTAQPLFIPKVFLMPFHPVRTLRELMGGEDSSTLSEKP